MGSEKEGGLSEQKSQKSVEDRKKTHTYIYIYITRFVRKDTLAGGWGATSATSLLFSVFVCSWVIGWRAGTWSCFLDAQVDKR